MRIISGIYGGRRFDTPKNLQARPTTDLAKGALFNILTNRLELEGLSALDLFAGTGSIGFELVSRGAQKVVSVEKNSIQQNYIEKIHQLLGLDHRHILLRTDVFRYIKSGCEQFDFIFADPPYDLPQLESIPSRVLDENCLLHPGGLFVLEHSRNNDFTQHPWFAEHRVYGSVNFTFFVRPEE